MSSETTDYVALVQRQSPLEIVQYGYSVKLTLDGGYYLNVQVFHGEEEISKLSVYLLNKNYEWRGISDVVDELHEKVVAAYDEYNQSFRNPDLLKELEAALNGRGAGMKVLVAGDEAEDTGFVVAVDDKVVKLERWQGSIL